MATTTAKKDTIVGDETFRWGVKVEAPTGVDGALEAVDVTDTNDVIVQADIDDKNGTKVGGFTVTREADGVLVFEAPSATLQAHADDVFYYDARIEIVSLDVVITHRAGSTIRTTAPVTNPA